jgi:heterodisulfide reductase subunit A
MKRFLVVGAGVTGFAAALELARQGHGVTILESSPAIGGKVLSYCCKATDSCSRCGVCVAHDGIAEALRHPRISILTGARIGAVDAAGPAVTVRGVAANPLFRHSLCVDCGACAAACPTRCISRYSRGGLTAYSVDYQRCLLAKGKKCAACADACGCAAIDAGAAEHAFDLHADGVVVATGHETFDPGCKPRLGYGRLPGVMTGLEAERTLSREAALTGANGREAASVAFIQCVGSRDPVLCRNFCSAVCCAYALRMARLLKARQPGADVTVYYIDIQNFDKVFTPFREGIEALGVRFVRGIPSSVSRAGSGRLDLLIEDPDGNRTTAQHDAVVLSVGMSPAEGSRRTAALFGLPAEEFGFFGHCGSKPGRIVAAGTCVEPQGIVESIASARAAAQELLVRASPARVNPAQGASA